MMIDTPLPTQKRLSAVAIWWRWMLSLLVGFLVGSVLAVPATFVGLNFVGQWTIDLGICEAGSGNLGCILRSGVIMGGLAIALPICLLQRLLMRRLIRRSWWWSVVSCLGWVLVVVSLCEVAYTPISGATMTESGKVIEVSISQNFGAVAQGIALSVGAGIVLSGLQWLLMSEEMPHSAWWIVLHGGLVLITAISILLILRGNGGLFGIWLFFSLFVLLYGAISGATLAKMAGAHSNDRPIQSPKDNPNRS